MSENTRDEATGDEAMKAAPAHSRVGFEPTSQAAFTSPLVLSYSAMNASFDELLVELFFHLGAKEGPHSHTFTGESYATCCTASLLLEDHMTGPGSVFLAVSGVVELTEVTRDGRIAGVLKDVVYAEATIDRATHESTLVEGGRTWHIPSLTFAASS